MNATGQITPNCNIAEVAANGECGPMANALFGTPVVQTTFAPNVMQGWFTRPYEWVSNATIQQELRPGLSAYVGYYRTTYGNMANGSGTNWNNGVGEFNNIDVTAANFTPYCVTVPTQAGLPTSGSQICQGLYNVVPAKFGQVQNVLAQNPSFGTWSEVFN